MRVWSAAMPRAKIEGRVVFHRIGRKTQTVNICTAENVEGVYEDRYSLDIAVDVSAAELAAQPDLASLRAWLTLHGGQPLSTDGRPGDRLPGLVEAASDTSWTADARAAVERVLVAVVDSFRERPYLHRVEHSLHAEIWSLLKQEPVLQGEFTLKDGRAVTQLVHKEWPETYPRKKADGSDRPRGLFDLAVLSPQQVCKSSLDQLVFGRIEPPIVIEVGLDYGLPHLEQDADKLKNSRVQSPYLLHLTRLRDKDRSATEMLLTSGGTPAAYGHLDPKTGVRWKHVHERAVSPV